MSEKRSQFFSGKNPISVVVGEITNVLRAQGNPTATGLTISSNADSPVISGVYYSIPQIQIGFMPYEDFKYSASQFNDDDNGIDNTIQHPWNSIGAVSLDALFVPYTTQQNSTRAGSFLPHFISITGTTNEPTVNELNPFNPFNSLTGVLPGGNELGTDPWMTGGHNISMALNYNPYDSGVDGTSGMVGATGLYPNGSGAPVDFVFEKDHFARKTVETQSIRGVGFKAPMILSGWGYDTNGNPVPGSGNTFHPEAAWNPSLWKSGPVDFRWDETRGVWKTSGGGAEIIKFTVTSPGNNIGQNATACDNVIATVTDIGCSTTTASVGDTGVIIYDDELCYFNLPVSLITGLKGTAQKFVNPFSGSGVDCLDQAAAQGACRWVVTGLCCGEEIT